MYLSAVEELIALGANVDVTLSEERMSAWKKEDAPCKLTQLGAAPFWRERLHNVTHLRTGMEASKDSLFTLIHLAVSHKNILILLSYGGCSHTSGICCRYDEVRALSFMSGIHAGSSRIHWCSAISGEQRTCGCECAHC